MTRGPSVSTSYESFAERSALLDTGAWRRLWRSEEKKPAKTVRSAAEYQNFIFSSFSALPQRILRSSAGATPRPSTVLMVGAIGPSGVSVA